MKKILALAVGMLLIPFTAFGMEAMDDSSMDSITGQGGVAISVSNVGIYSAGETVWYQGGTEGDGSTWVGITAGDEVTLIDPFGLGAGLNGATNINEFAQLVIGDEEATDFASSALMIQTSDAISFLGGASGVVVTLGTLDIRTYTGETATEIGLGYSNADGDAPTDFDGTSGTFGRMSASDGRTVILGGQIGITTVDEFVDANTP